MAISDNIAAYGRSGMAIRMPSRDGAILPASRLPTPVVVYLLCVVIPIWFHAGPLYLSTLRLVLLVMILPLTARLLIGKYGRLILTDILFLLHFIWATIALAVNNPSRVIENAGANGIEFIGAYVLARAYIRSPAEFIALSRWIVFLAACTLPLALYEARTGQPIFLELIRHLPGIETFEKIRPDPRLGLFRAQTVFAHAIHHGLFCSVAFSLCFVALKGTFSRSHRVLTSVAVAFSAFLALSSGALLALFLQITLIAWAAIFNRISWRWWLLVGLFIFLYVAIDLLSTRTPLKVFMTYATFSAHSAYFRSIIFDWGMINVWANPVFGIGLNDWVRPWYMRSGSMDNFWLVMAVRYGIPGFLFLALGYVIVIVRVMARKFDRDVLLAQLRRAWVFTFLGLTFTLCTVHVWSSIYSFVFFMFGSGVWLIFAQPEEREVMVKAPTTDRRLGYASRTQPVPKPATASPQAVGTLPVRPGPRYSRYPADIRRRMPTSTSEPDGSSLDSD